MISKDQNAEHYRHGAFSDFLQSKNEVSDDEVTAIFNLEDNGPDKCDLHENRVLELIRSGILDDEQFESISRYPEVLERPIQKRYLRERLLRKIYRHSVTECFEEIKKCKDAQVQRFVLTRNDIELEHVNWLATNGINKKVRNISLQLLNSRRFRG